MLYLSVFLFFITGCATVSEKQYAHTSFVAKDAKTGQLLPGINCEIKY